MIISPSTGYLYVKGIYDLPRQLDFVRDSGANGLEIALNIYSDDRLNGLSQGGNFGCMEYCSLHLPNKSEDPDFKHQLSRIRRKVKTDKVNGIVLHPSDNLEDYLKELMEFQLPIGVENLDSTNSAALSKPEFLDFLMQKYGFMFVFDVQHAYGHDPSMRYARELLNMADGRLMHLHLSGQNGDNGHSLVNSASNRDIIMDFLGEVVSKKDVPIIIEGKYSTAEELKKEIEFVRTFLKTD